jgi:thiol peroxidase
VLLRSARISGYLGHLEDDPHDPHLSTIEDEPTMAETRKGEVTFKGNPVELVGPKLKAGEKAPDFACVGAGLAMVGLKDSAGKARLFNVVPSLDTPVCNTQTRRFSQELQSLGEKVAAYTVSLDMPFAQARWCTDAKVDNIKNLSDVHDHSFGQHYGVLIQGLPIPLLARAIFVVDPSDTIKYVEIVPEIAQEPTYEPALKALREAAGA